MPGREGQPGGGQNERLTRLLREGDGGDYDYHQYIRTDESFQNYAEALHILDKATGEPKEQAKKEVERRLEVMEQAVLVSEEQLLDEKLLRLLTIVPYDDREHKFLQSGLEGGLRIAKSEKWTNGKEIHAWLKRATGDLTWCQANFNLLKGLSTPLSGFWNYELMLSAVKKLPREDPAAEDYRRAFGKRLRGLELTPEERQNFPNPEAETLREKAVRFQDDAFWARITCAAVSQFVPEDPASQDCLRKNLTPAEVFFFQNLFRRVRLGADGDGWISYEDTHGKPHRAPEYMLNWNSMSSLDVYKNKYIALMQAIVLTGARGELEKIAESAHGDESYNQEQMDRLITRVNEVTQKILENLDSKDKDLDVRLAAVVVKSGIIFDWGHFNSAPMSWSYSHKIVEGKLVRKIEVGGPTIATDANTAYYWAWNYCGSMKKGWPGGDLFPKPTAEFIKEVTDHPPTWKPEFDPRSDPTLQATWDELMSHEKEFDPVAFGWFKKMVWAWQTEAGVIPVLMPPTFNSLNFLDTVTLDDPPASAMMRLEDGGREISENPTIWDELKRGKNMSDLKWENMGDQAYYRWLITIDQLSRFFATMKDPSGEMAEEFYRSPGQINAFDKRVDLGLRDERIPHPVLIMATAPFLVALKLAKSASLIGPQGNDPEIRDNWADKMSAWLVAFEDLPKERDAVGGLTIRSFNTGMKKLLLFYGRVLAPLGVEAMRKTQGRATQNSKTLKVQLEPTNAKTSGRPVIES
jgi:hypothetical protein